MSTIEDLKAKVQRLEDQLKTARESLHRAMIEAHPIKVGDLGTYGGIEAIVSSVVIRNGRVQIYARTKTKSGWHGTERDPYLGFEPYPKRESKEGGEG